MTRPRMPEAQRRHTNGPLQPLDGYARRSTLRLNVGLAGLLFVIVLVPLLLWLIAQTIEPSASKENPGDRSPERRPAPVNTVPVNGEQVP